jgi:cytochrome c oxidase subunit II
MKKNLIFTSMLLLFVFVNSYCFAADHVDRRNHQTHLQQKQEVKGPELSGKVENGIRIVEVKALRYKFEPDPIVVRLGEKVRLVVTSIDVAHGIAILEFKINLSVPAGKTENVEFVADKKGSFPAYCSVYCGSGHGHMQASLVVK